MLMKSFIRVAGLGVVLVAGGLPAAEPVAPASFPEIYNLIRSNLAGAKPEELDRAAVRGLLQQLQPQVILAAKTPATPSAGAVLAFKTNLFEEAFAYVRPGVVVNSQVEAVQAALEKISVDKKLKGLVLDLRFARGQDYAAAAVMAGLFLPPEKASLSVGGVTLASSAKAATVSLPMAVLVNHETAGAAEALAALLRQNKVALLIGGTTAGEAFAYKDFPLSNGERLHIATSTVKLGDGSALPAQGLKPDIAVVASAVEERAWLDDPYKELGRLALLGAGGSASTNAPRKRINEAELVRRQREGQNPDDDTPSARSPRETETARPLVRDAVLARALDLLKGLALVRQFRAP